MKTDIFRPIKFGKEVFHPISFDENFFVMEWTVDTGGKVPAPVILHMEEHFKVTKGELIFHADGKKSKIRPAKISLFQKVPSTV